MKLSNKKSSTTVKVPFRRMLALILALESGRCAQYAHNVDNIFTSPYLYLGLLSILFSFYFVADIKHEA